MMLEWLKERPWIWIVLLLTLLVAGSLSMLIIAENNKPTSVKEG